MLGRRLTTIDYAENAPVTAADIERGARGRCRRSRTWRWCTARPAPASSIRCTRSPQVVARHGRGPDRRCDEFLRRAGDRCAHAPPSMPSSPLPASASRGRRAWASSSRAARRWSAARATVIRWRWTCTTSGSTCRRPRSGATRRRRTWWRPSIARSRSISRKAASRARGARYAEQLPHAARGHGQAGPAQLPARGDPGADHRHVLRARHAALPVQELLQRGQGARLHPVSGQAHHGGDLPGRLHGTARRARHARGRGGGRQVLAEMRAAA